MKIINNSLSKVAFMFLFTLAILIPAFAANEVKLVEAQVTLDPMTPGGYCPSCYSIKGEVEVENLDYNKTVEIVYNAGQGWETVAASFKSDAGNGKERWSFSKSLGYISNPEVQFAVKYSVNGQEYWDNNNGEDYTITSDTSIYEDKEVKLAKAWFGGGLGCYGMCSDFSADIRIKNIAFDKDVKLVYSLNGRDWKELSATYRQSLEGGYEIWRAYISYAGTRDTNRIQFALSYTVNSVTYWDNNFGNDYQISE